MDNVVTIAPERPRQRRAAVPSGGARILLFTGVRYVRDEVPALLPRPREEAPESVRM